MAWSPPTSGPGGAGVTRGTRAAAARSRAELAAAEAPPCPAATAAPLQRGRTGPPPSQRAHVDGADRPAEGSQIGLCRTASRQAPSAAPARRAEAGAKAHCRARRGGARICAWAGRCSSEACGLELGLKRRSCGRRILGLARRLLREQHLLCLRQRREAGSARRVDCREERGRRPPVLRPSVAVARFVLRCWPRCRIRARRSSAATATREGVTPRVGEVVFLAPSLCVSFRWC